MNNLKENLINNKENGENKERTKIDLRKELAEKFGYDYVGAFSPEGLAVAKKEDKVGFIDQTGKEVIKIEYSGVYGFSEGLAVVYKGNKCGFINEKGEEVTELKYEDAHHFSEGSAIVKTRKNHEEKLGLIDKSGKEITDLKYDFMGNFHDGLASVGKGGDTEETKYEYKYGFIDQKGKEITDFKYDEVKNFSDGLAMVKIDDKWGLIDKTGKEVAPIVYHEIGKFSPDYGGLAMVEKIKDSRCLLHNLINTKGEEVIKFECRSVNYFNDGLFLIKKNEDGKEYYIDKEGRIIFNA